MSKPSVHVCSDWADAPSQNGYAFHLYYGTSPCGAAMHAKRWYMAEMRAGHPLPDYKGRYNMVGWECGTEAEGPDIRHERWHQRNGTKPCRAAAVARAWAVAERRAGHPIPDYQPRSPGRPPKAASVT